MEHKMINFEDNISLVGKVYQNYYARFKWLKEDLIQVGSIGLWRACKSFNEEKNTCFSTYAFKCIKNEMAMLLRKECKHYEYCVELDILQDGSYDKYLIDTKARNEQEGACELELSLKDLYMKDLLLDYANGGTIASLSKKYNMGKDKTSKILKRDIEIFRRSVAGEISDEERTIRQIVKSWHNNNGNNACGRDNILDRCC